MTKFINRESELALLNEQYQTNKSSLIILYGRRRVGKTTLIKEFIHNKQALYFLANEENDSSSMKNFTKALSEYTGQNYLANTTFNDWKDLFQVFRDYPSEEKKIIVLDELPYMVNANSAFPSILQWVWDSWFKEQNVMMILCGSLIHMMEKHTLNYNSPLYGRRTGQIKMKQIDFEHYHEFYKEMPYRDLIEHYAVTGGIPKYIELFEQDRGLFNEIERLILRPTGMLFEEPEFLLRREVEEIGSYFSIIKSIAAGNHRLSKISGDIGIKQTSLPKYLKTLIDLDILEREVPITEKNPEKSKMGLYHIKDNYIRFWFRFIFPERARLEMGHTGYVLEKIRSTFIINHVAYIYENVCKSELWKLANLEKLQFNSLGRWWNNREEIDIVALDNTGKDIVFAECKYQSQPMDTDVFYKLLQKKEHVIWNKEHRQEKFVLFSISGFAPNLLKLGEERYDLILIGDNAEVIM